jgi:hypothetical protein
MWFRTEASRLPQGGFAQWKTFELERRAQVDQARMCGSNK